MRQQVSRTGKTPFVFHERFSLFFNLLCNKCVLEAFILNSTRGFIGKIIEWIHKQLGHSSIQVTMDIYGHLLPDTEKEAAVRLDAILAPAG